MFIWIDAFIARGSVEYSLEGESNVEHEAVSKNEMESVAAAAARSFRTQPIDNNLSFSKSVSANNN